MSTHSVVSAGGPGEHTVNSNDSAISISDRIDFLTRKKQQRHLTRKETDELRSLRNAIIPHLLMRSYHLPGYNYWEDLGQYLTNNHPVFGLCCHHKLHPIKFKIRFISLIGSVLFGLAVTNIVFISFALTKKNGYNDTYWQYQFGNFSTGSEAVDQQVFQIQVTQGNIALWTIGSATHALYDTVMWEMATCASCMTPGISRKKIERYQTKGFYFVILFAIFAFVACGITVLLRETVFYNVGSVTTDVVDNNTTNTTNVTRYYLLLRDLQELNVTVLTYPNGTQHHTVTTQGGISWNWYFIISYFVELSLNYFFYYPVIGIIAFTGILGCNGYIPALSGRPYEVKMMEMDHELITSMLETMQSENEGLSSKSSHNLSNHGIPFSRHAFGRSGSRQNVFELARTSSHDNLFGDGGSFHNRSLLKGGSQMNLARSKSKGNVYGTGSGHGSSSRSFFNRSGSTREGFVLDLAGNGKATLTPSDKIPKVPQAPSLRRIKKGTRKNALLTKVNNKSDTDDNADGDVEMPTRKMSVLKEGSDFDDNDDGSFAEDTDNEEEINFEKEASKHQREPNASESSVLEQVASSLDDIQRSVNK